EVETNPLTLWSIPGQMPSGPDALPPFQDWHWTVVKGSGAADTPQWTIPRWTSDLARVTTWNSQNYIVTGVSKPIVPVQVALPLTNPTPAPGVGIVLNPGSSFQGPLFPKNDTDYAQLVKSLKPTVIRFGEVDGNTGAHWSSTAKAPIFNFSNLDRSFNLTAAVGAKVFYSVSAGSWGDGNLMPPGMPMDTTYKISKGATWGYLPTSTAYRSYMHVIVNHIHSMHQHVAYWSIGNEMPLVSQPVVTAYTGIFNVAQQVIHATYPHALVGSDLMMDRNYLPYFATHAKGVGFLSFHFYPAIGVCVNQGQYCPPSGSNLGTLDARLWQPVADIAHVGFFAPHLAQQMWFNITHRWLPVIDSESNLNGIGGGAASGANGTDPRQQTLFGAAWAAATLIRGASENLSTFTYFAMTGPATVPTTVTGTYGGWGFGLTSEGLNDSDVRYAPYWALNLWSQAVPAGAPGAALYSPDPSTVRAYAVRTPTGVNVVVVNLVAVQVAIPVTFTAPGYAARSVSTLDQNTYVERFNPGTQTLSLQKSGLGYTALSGTKNGTTVVLNGYGVGVIRFVHVGPVHVHPLGLRSGSATARHSSSPGGATGRASSSAISSAMLSASVSPSSVPVSGDGSPIAVRNDPSGRFFVTDGRDNRSRHPSS
ncbi:MAG: hypothetical protein L3K08_08575, partial [Thermoplasmata archaeon]|nr:hypothetical protein [Thermoplasmata archaeon]